MIMLTNQRDLFRCGGLLAALHLTDRGPAGADDMSQINLRLMIL